MTKKCLELFYFRTECIEKNRGTNNGHIMCRTAIQRQVGYNRHERAENEKSGPQRHLILVPLCILEKFEVP